MLELAAALIWIIILIVICAASVACCSICRCMVVRLRVKEIVSFFVKLLTIPFMVVVMSYMLHKMGATIPLPRLGNSSLTQ